MRNRVIRSMLLMVGMLLLATASFAQVRVSIGFAPPMLPVYDQPICPGDGYIWTPGYWAYGDDGYYWVDGEWVMAPEEGYLWTPGYWGWGDGGYFFNDGYWGPEVGFYGGINYGFGYFGHGYEGGRWQGGHFFYNTSLNNVNRGSMHNTYDARVSVGVENHVSFNGGNGGVNARATSAETAAANGRRVGPVASQTSHAQAARNDPQARVSVNHGTPARTSAPSNAGGGNTAARTENNVRPAAAAVHPTELPAVQRPAAPNTGNVKTDQKYQQQQDKLVANQTKDRQNLQQKQDNEHQQLVKQNATPAKTQQVEQQHAQQTQKLQQTHTQQTQQMQQRQAPPARGGGGGRGGRGQ
jgi:WXXGXW repeat (2 copies)